MMRRCLPLVLISLMLLVLLSGCVYVGGGPGNSAFGHEVVKGKRSGEIVHAATSDNIKGLRVEYINVLPPDSTVIDLEIVYGDEWELTIPEYSGIPNRYALSVTEKSGYIVLSGENDAIYDLDEINLKLVCPVAPSLDLGGAFKVFSDDALSGDDVRIHVAGASNIELEMELSGSLDIKLEGASTLTLGGQASQMDVSVAGACKVDSLEMRVSDADIDIAGAGDCDVYVTESLDVSIAGAGTLRYKTDGNDIRLHRSIAGLGTVRQID